MFLPRAARSMHSPCCAYPPSSLTRFVLGGGGVGGDGLSPSSLSYVGDSGGVPRISSAGLHSGEAGGVMACGAGRQLMSAFAISSCSSCDQVGVSSNGSCRGCFLALSRALLRFAMVASGFVIACLWPRLCLLECPSPLPGRFVGCLTSRVLASRSFSPSSVAAARVLVYLLTLRCGFVTFMSPRGAGPEFGGVPMLLNKLSAISAIVSAWLPSGPASSSARTCSSVAMPSLSLSIGT